MSREASVVGQSSGPLHTTAESLRQLRRMKHNPLPRLKPAMLARALDAFELGELREAVTLWEAIAKRDDTIASVKAKREMHVAQLDRQVTALPNSGAEGARHKEVLEDFWNNVRAVNAFDRNEKGGFKRLVKQMMTAESYCYAAHHIIWEPRGDKLRATFEFVPLWLFENKTGKLRYLETPTATEGVIMQDHEWMVTCGSGLMIACSIGYLAKRSAFNDWLIFSEKFSVPGTLGRTPHGKDTPEGKAMRQAVETFGHDWTAVIYGDDGTHTKPIEIIQAEGNPAGMPMPAVIERVDRKMAAMYRGADLSSMSSKDGEGTGASLQDKETDILLGDDAENINQTLEQVSRLVIEWHFGYGVEPLAKVELLVPIAEDGDKVLNAATTLADRGARVSLSSLMDRLAIQAAETDADAMTLSAAAAPAPGAVAFPAEDQFNSIWEADELLPQLQAALAEDLQPLGRALAGALQAGDQAAMKMALRKISAGLDLPAAQPSALLEDLTALMTTALAAETDEEANADRGEPVGFFRVGGAVRPIYAASFGTPLSDRGQSTPLSISRQAGSILAAIQAADDTRQGQAFSLGRVGDDLAARVKDATGRDISGMELRIDSDFVAHARRFHPNLTTQDFLQIPQLLSKSRNIEASYNNRGLPTVNFRLRRSERDYLLVGMELNKSHQLAMNTLKKSAQGKTL